MRKFISTIVFLLLLFLVVGCGKKKECEIKGVVFSKGRPVPNIEFGYSLKNDPNHSSEFAIGKTNRKGEFKIQISSIDKDNVIYFGNPDSIFATKKFYCDDVIKIDTIFLDVNY